MQQKLSFEEFKELHRPALLIGTIRALGLVRRVPELLRERGWRAEDQDLVAVLTMAIACRKLGAGGEVFRRPEGADGVGGKWPAGARRATASQIVDTLELDDLLILP